MGNQFVLHMTIAIAFSGFAATPQVKNVKAMQQYPYENKVYISYEVVGNVDANTGSFLFVSAKDKTTGKIYGEVFADVSYLTGDTGVSEGSHKVVWDVASQGVTINSTNVVFTVMYLDDPLYLVVDLSGGANASSYPVSYLGAVPSGGWTDEYKTTKLVLRWIKAGTFIMGGNQTEESCRVTLTKPFYIGLFEVTQKQWELVMGSNPCSSTSYGKGNSYPVHYVSYNMIRGSSNGAQWPSSSAVDSDSFLGKLRARTGLNFDLPTAAQWEYASLACTTTTYYWGNLMDGNYAWYWDNSDGTTHVVGTKMPNAWGLHDMSGNVWEWCLDWGGTQYGTDPTGAFSGFYRVKRGGSWDNSADYCASSYRYSSSPSSVNNYNGFRLVRTLSE